MNYERAGSIVKDLREVLQDVVAPDLKSMVRGLAELKEQMKADNALLRQEIAAVEKRTADRIELSEQRTAERIERVYDKIEINNLTRRNAELERELEQVRISQQTQQH